MKNQRRGVFIALALSVAAHGLAFVGMSRHLPEDAEPIATHFDARLSAARREPRKVRAPRAKALSDAPDAVAQTAMPVADEVTPTAPAPVAAAPEPTVSAAAPEQPAAASSAPSVGNFPARARLGFRLTLGDRGVLIGQAVQTWQSDGKSYRIESRSTSAGLVALFKTVTLIQSSEGAMDEGGIRPALFRTERDGKLTEEAVFDWPGGQLRLKSGDKVREVALTPGAQDVLSLFYQSALTYRGDETMTIDVATGKSFNSYRLVRVGEEWLSTRAGRFATIHLKRVASAGEDGVDIWLGRDVAWLPVRIRFADRKGDVYDQVVEDIEIDGARPVLPAADKGGDEEPPPG